MSGWLKLLMKKETDKGFIFFKENVFIMQKLDDEVKGVDGDMDS